MSQQITEAQVQQYGANVFHLSQQKGSRLKGLVRNESQNSKAMFFDRLGQVTAVKKAGRHSSTPQIDTPHSRRRVTLVDYEWADLVDSQDKIRMIWSPESEYVMAAMWAMGRAMDDEVIAGLGGTAYSGEDGSTTVALPNAQKYAANNGTNFTNLNIETLRAVKMKFDAADIDESIPRYFGYTSSQLNSLLSTTQITSADYNTVKALVAGQVDTFLGFKFVRLERFLNQVDALSASPTTGEVGSGSSVVGYRKCYAWAQDGALLSIGQNPVAKITERADKSYAMQPYVCMSIGATRMEEEKVVEVICKES